MKKIMIWTDGACSRNPGVGGWACVIVAGKHRKELSGSEKETTNNRMEMQAAVNALSVLTKSCEVELRTDSELICNAFNQNWINSWENNNWETKAGTPVVNQDLWKQLIELDNTHQVDWVWVKGHAEEEENNRCDELAVKARTELEESLITPDQKHHKAVKLIKQARTRLHNAQKLCSDLFGEEFDTEGFKQLKKEISALAKTIKNRA